MRTASSTPARRRTWAVLGLSLALVLPGCGGGGDNAGTCFGSTEVCGRDGVSQNNGSVSGGSTTTTGDSTSGNEFDLSNRTCASFGSQAEAQAALTAGATQLDSNGDGIACN